ncbi:MAG TPA: hypothetical protein VFH37_02755 [Candidatus Saccharimonadales bacterium]|nr:hypothetical protein [Candidatus Saccharimonadales bacterium]
MSEFGNEITDQLPTFGYENARQFFGWMFPNVHPSVIEELSEGQLKSIYEILVEHATQRFETEKDFRRKNLIKVPFGITRRWFAGKSISEIASDKGKQDGSIRIPLMEHAKRLGEVENLYDLIDESDKKTAELVEATLAGTEKAISQMLQEETLPEPGPEPAAEPAEEIVEIPLAPSCEEIAQLAVQKTAEITGVEDHQPEPDEEKLEPVLMEPRVIEQLIDQYRDEYPMLEHMSPENAAIVLRNLKLG